MPAPYKAPLDDMRFALLACARLESVLGLAGYREFSEEIIQTILEEAAKFAAQTLSPLNAVGDRQGSMLEGGTVKTPAGFKEAYHDFIQNGWNAAPVAAEHGGQGLPFVLSTLVSEIWHGANMGFGLCPMLTQSAIELLSHYGSDALKAAYLPKLVSGDWAGTMCMTEPQAGSDVGAVRTKAVPENDHYRISGTKIFITYGEQDFTDNIIHMVLARLPDAAAGTKGLSLFLVPKFLQDGSRNDLQCVSLEHKMGIHASPTCVMAFGEKEGAIGYLIGTAGEGMKAMFAMMNPARFAVGLEAIGVLSNASQLAEAFANERVQGRVTGESGASPISHHPDIARMLGGLRAHSEALRALALYTASYMDMAKHHADETVRASAQARVDLLIPVIKSHSSGMASLLCSDAMQVAGGMGYIEETGFAQLLRDVRITMIYEGTNGIQALDLVGRKLPMENFQVVRDFISEIWQCAVTLARDTKLQPIGSALESACGLLDTATIWMEQRRADATSDIAAARDIQTHASSYLTLFGLVAEAYMLARCAEYANGAGAASFDKKFLEQKNQTALFFMRQSLPEALALHARIMGRF